MKIVYTFSMDFTLPLRDARNRFAEVVDRATHDEATVLTRHGKRVAAVVPVEMLDAFRRWEDERALRFIEERRASPTFSFDEVLQETLDRD